jgi:hypothetical protein
MHNIIYAQEHPTTLSVICNDSHPLFSTLNNFIKSRTPSDTSGCIVCSCLTDTAYAGYQYHEYGMYCFKRGSFPPSGVYLFYKNNDDERIRILKRYKLSYLQRKMSSFFKKNNISKYEQVKYLHGFARFYDDYVFSKYGIEPGTENYDF